MAGFNTFPLKQASGVSATGSLGVYPSIVGDNTYIGNGGSNNGFNPRSLEGFDGDGDFVELPGSGAGTVDYFNNAGVSQSGWPISIANVDATSTKWLGWEFDATDSLLYVVTSRSATSIVLSSINSAGTIVNIGSPITITAFDFAPDWGAATAASAGISNIYRDADGSGNFTIRADNGARIMQEVVITDAGVLSVDTADVLRIDVAGAPLYKTPAGNYIGLFDANTDRNSVIISVGTGTATSSKTFAASPSMDTGIFAGSTSGGLITQWKGRIALSHFATALLTGPRYYTVATFNAYADALAKSGGSV